MDKTGIEYTEVSDIAEIENKGFKTVPQLEVGGVIYDYYRAVDLINAMAKVKAEPKTTDAMPVRFLSAEFLSKYPDHPSHMTNIGLFTYYRTYSRFIAEEGRRETWKETVIRAVEYNIALDYKHRIKIGLPVPLDWLKREAEELFDAVFNLKMLLSGRTLWVANSPASEKYPMSNFNCSFTNIERWEDLGELFYLLMLGSGVGFKSTPKLANAMPKIRVDTTLVLSEYNPLPANQRLESTETRMLENGFAKIYVGDSKEGWRDALLSYFNILTNKEHENIHTIKVSFNSVRPKGERLKLFGGTASGPEPLMEMFQGFDNVLKNKIDPSLAPIEPDGLGYGNVRPIHILDMGNLIASNVISGGVRRSAEIFLFDPDDTECLLAKYGVNGFWKESDFERHEDVRAQLVKMGRDIPDWFDGLSVKSYFDGSLTPYNQGRANIGHRRLSNNSLALTGKLDADLLHLIFLMLQLEGEPGFINLDAASKRRENGHGVNPCFRGDMRLLTTEGYKRFDELDGQEVSVVNVDGDISTGKVWSNGEKEVWEMGVKHSGDSDSGVKKIYVTKDHYFLTVCGREVQAQHLQGDQIAGYDGHYDCLYSVPTGEYAKVYDFSEPLTHWGVVEGLIAHNCGEILLDSKQQCNLTTVNLTSFVHDGEFCLSEAIEVQRLSARAGTRMTLIDLELPEWDAKQKRDRLIGCSMTGAMDALGDYMWDDQGVFEYFLKAMRSSIKEASEKYAYELRIPIPLLKTTSKPEGTGSLVLGGVSPGIHDSHAPYFIRRIRVSSDDALAKMALDIGWPVYPEVGTPGNSIENARTLVIEFPVKSGAKRTKEDVGAIAQFSRYLTYQNCYTDHNTSNTITVKPNEWEALEYAISEEWDDFVGVSFLPHDGGTYQLAPYESITKEEYERRAEAMVPFSIELLAKYETVGVSDIDDADDPDCATGACPVR